MTTESDRPDLKTTYQNLMAEYVRLLRFVASGGVNWVTRQVIEDHIRANLVEITEAFTLLEYYLLDPLDDKDVFWLRQQRDYLTRLGDQLANIRQQVVAFLWRGLTLLFASAVLEFAGPTDQAKNVNFLLNNIAGIVQTLLGTFGVLLLVVSFAYAGAATFLINVKRSYLKPGYDEYGQKRTEGPLAEEGVSIYKLENDLFKLLSRKKPQEPAWDVWGLAMLMVFLAGLLFFLTNWLASIAPDQYVTVTWIAGISGVIMSIILLGQEIRHRLQRER